MSDPITASLLHRIQSRAARGRAKYGVGLDRTDLSLVQWCRHLQEELLDAAGYLERVIEDLEGDDGGDK